MKSDQPRSRRVAVAGATGLIGSQLVQGLCRDPEVTAVHALARRAPGFTHPKLHMLAVDFSVPITLPPLDEMYLALGTTIKVAGSQAAMRAIDVDANLALARAARAAGATRLGLISAMGANAASPVFYNRIKGELEQALAGLGFEALVIARPSLLRGDRAALGQHTRSGEIWGERLNDLLRPLIPRQWQAIAAADVAAALAQTVPTASGRVLLTSGAMQGAAQRSAGTDSPA